MSERAATINAYVGAASHALGQIMAQAQSSEPNDTAIRESVRDAQRLLLDITDVANEAKLKHVAPVKPDFRVSDNPNTDAARQYYTKHKAEQEPMTVPVGALMNPPAAMMRSKAPRFTTRSLTTGKARARQGSR